MANKFTKLADSERRKAADAILARKAEAEAEAARYAKERGAAETKVRLAKKKVAECMAELAELATA